MAEYLPALFPVDADVGTGLTGGDSPEHDMGMRRLNTVHPPGFP